MNETLDKLTAFYHMGGRLGGIDLVVSLIEELNPVERAQVLDKLDALGRVRDRIQLNFSPDRPLEVEKGGQLFHCATTSYLKCIQTRHLIVLAGANDWRVDRIAIQHKGHDRPIAVGASSALFEVVLMPGAGIETRLTALVDDPVAWEAVLEGVRLKTSEDG